MKDRIQSKIPTIFHTQLFKLKQTSIVSFKTITELFSFRRFFIYVLIMISVPLLVLILIFIPPDIVGYAPTDFSDISVYSASMLINFNLVAILYYWPAGLIFTLVLSGKSAGLIADEVDRGTMLTLVSKPISRIQIVTGKYIAVFVYGAVFNFISLFLIFWISVLTVSGNILHFFGTLPFFGLIFGFSLFVEFIFLNISISLSSIMSNGRKAGTVVFFIIISSYLVFFLFRMMGDIYTKYSLYYFDIGYHLFNILIFFIDITKIIPPSQMWQDTFLLLYRFFVDPAIDPSQGINNGSLELINYVDPIVSLLLLVGLSILLLLIGIIRFKKREITN